jgi:hypothetical protein
MQISKWLPAQFFSAALIGFLLTQRLIAADVASLPADVMSVITAARYDIQPARNSSNRSFTAVNPKQRMKLRFTTTGVELRSESWRSAWSLRSVGFGADQVPLSPGRMESIGNRITITRGAGISEWYINAANGIEQGFTLQHPPSPRQSSERLRLVIGIEGDLRARTTLDNKSGLLLATANGAAALRYDHLVVIDCFGRKLPAEIGISPQNGDVFLDVDDRNAKYPITIDPTFTQEAFITASNAGAGDAFGRSIAISGDTIVVGAPNEDSAATGVDGDMADNSAQDSGAAYVFVRNGSAWTQQAYLKASNSGAGDLFGYSVAISGDTIVVGAYKEASIATGINGDQANNEVPDSGAAYVFVRSGSTWAQQAYLKRTVPGAPIFGMVSAQFGYSVAISGETIIVGAFTEISNSQGVNVVPTAVAAESGAAFVFVRNGATWTQEAYLKASNATASAHIASVAISGETVVLGSECEKSVSNGVNGDQTTSTFGLCRGAAYVFVRNAGTWAQQAYLKASNTSVQSSGLGFGSSVAIVGDTVVVGAPGETSNSTGVDGDQANNSLSYAGAAYVFRRTGVNWQQQAYLKSSNTRASDFFGASVGIAGEFAVVGSPRDAGSSGATTGAAYVFQRTGEQWASLTSLRASQPGDTALGIAVSITPERIAAGGFADSGAAFVFSIVTNTQPSVTPAIVSLPAGAQTTTSIAIVTDNEDSPGALLVAIDGANPSNGVTLSGVTNNGGNVSALISAACTASNTNFNLRATDSGSLFTNGSLSVSVTPSAPGATAAVAVGTLSPPNANFINVGLSATATGICSPILSVKVYSNEDDETPSAPNMLHSPDAQDVASGTLRLRAERSNGGSGRVYLIVAKSTNLTGGSQIAAVNAMAASAKAYALANNGNPPAGYFVVGDGPIVGPKQ